MVEDEVDETRFRVGELPSHAHVTLGSGSSTNRVDCPPFDRNFPSEKQITDSLIVR
jgi:hypothetical protein